MNSKKCVLYCLVVTVGKCQYCFIWILTKIVLCGTIFLKVSVLFDLIKIVWTIACDIPISEVIINVVRPLKTRFNCSISVNDIYNQRIINELERLSLSTSVTKWSNNLKQSIGNSWQIVWVCFTILWGWHLKG